MHGGGGDIISALGDIISELGDIISELHCTHVIQGANQIVSPRSLTYHCSYGIVFSISA